MNDNPMDAGTPPEASGAPPGIVAPVVLTPEAKQYLDQTRPWVRFMAVLIFAGAGFMVVAGFAMVAMGVFGGLGGPTESAAMSAIGGALVGFLYLLMACLYVPPGVFLHRYAGAITRLKATSTSGALEDAMRHQRSFWRFVGVLSIVAAVLSIAMVALVFVFGVVGAMISRR